MPLSRSEILETIRMLQMEHLDIRTVTLGISLLDCAGGDGPSTAAAVKAKLLRLAGRLVPEADRLGAELGIPIINKRIAVTPVSLLGGTLSADDLHGIGLALDEAAAETGVDFIGGFSALVQKGATPQEERLLEVMPRTLAATSRLCASVNLADTRSGINMDAVAAMGRIIKDIAAATADCSGIGCARLVVFANMPGDNPFMAGAVHGVGEGEAAVNVGISGPGVVRSVVSRRPEADLGALAEEIKRAAFKITRMGELVGRLMAERLDLPFGIVDLSLAPTPTPGDSVAEILEAMGLEFCGAHGSTAALAMLNDAVKKGGAMASSCVGGLSGAFIPVSEDAGMIRAAEEGALSLDKLEAMTSVCSVGLDMIFIPGDTPAETISAIIADEMAIGVINNKTTAVRLVPVPGAVVGDRVEFGGLLGGGPVMSVGKADSTAFIRRGGRIPAPLHALRN
ncbi:MAG: PFL family protein [Candidatus Dojkabacteria bacterium]